MFSWDFLPKDECLSRRAAPRRSQAGNSHRRAFLQTVPLSLSLGATWTMAAENNDAVCLDYGRSFIGNSAEFNQVRFWIESRTTVTDSERGVEEVFYQCGSCKSENTFAERNLFIEDNYDFLPILGGRDWLIFRRPSRLSATYRRVQRDVWGTPNLKLRWGRRVQVLDSFAAIRAASEQGLPIVAQTELVNEATKLSAVIEYPVKTLNVLPAKDTYQVDTGPIAFPDLTERQDALIDCLQLAFVAFNAPHFADFIIEQPTDVQPDAETTEQIYHYSKPFSLPARNRLVSHAID